MEMLKIIKKAGVQAMEQTAPMGILLGTVKSTSPLVINIEQRMDIPAEFLLLTDNVVDCRATLSFDNPEIKNVVRPYSMADEAGADYKLAFQSNVKNDITIYNGLEAGDQVLLLRMQGGQKFIVLNRVVAA